MIKLNYNDFYTLWGEATESSDREMYVSEWSTSDIFYPDFDVDGPDMQEVAGALGNIWDVAHTSLYEMRKRSGMTQAGFSKLLCVPFRTVQNWEYHGRRCPSYYRLMIADYLGLLKVKRNYP